ncbi:MAG: polysaccharide biosynthesis/export family protein [Lentisphaeria bacterium]|nr:polysaccharide biosynthesis/export family protein [Lentisphaeria bacterium]
MSYRILSIVFVLTLSLLTSCQSTNPSKVVALKDGETARFVSNGELSEFLCLSSGMRTSGATSKQNLKALQDSKLWPAGEFDADSECTPATLKAITGLLKARQDAQGYRDARLQRASKVTIHIYDVGVGTEDNIELETVVSKHGYVTLPFVKRVKVAGLTAEEAENKIHDTYISGGFFKNLTVDVTGAAGSLYITGEVNKPGRLDFEGSMSLCDLIITSGELTQFADRSEIKLIRNKRVTTYDYDDILEGKKNDPILKPGDRITVSRRIF